MRKSVKRTSDQTVGELALVCGVRRAPKPSEPPDLKEPQGHIEEHPELFKQSEPYGELELLEMPEPSESPGLTESTEKQKESQLSDKFKNPKKVILIRSTNKNRDLFVPSHLGLHLSSGDINGN